MAGSRPFAHLTAAALKERAARAVAEVEHASGERLDAVLLEVAAIRDEMIDRLGGDSGDDTSGVREPRRPLPGGSAASVAAVPDDED